MTEPRRLIEVAFPLKQASLDSVHEKNVRQGHISTLHIWPARRPLAACRAALIATLLPDPGTPEARKRLVERIGGKVVERIEKKKLGGRTIEVVRQETSGGVLHWGREASPDMDWFREEIRKTHGGRAPRVLDPFAGGGAIPLEAMRLGCEVTAVDINPVAWLLLRCTLEYPKRIGGTHRALPSFAVETPEFMEGFFKGSAKLTKKQLERQLEAVQQPLFPPPNANLAWHIRAWGLWVLRGAQESLTSAYPTIDGKRTLAYLWARTVVCKNCRATIPLVKTCWLCRKDNNRVLLRIEPRSDKAGVDFSVDTDVASSGGNAAQRREHDRRIGQGTMGKAGAWCPCCGQPGTVAVEVESIRQEGRAGRLGTVMTAAVVQGPKVKEFRAVDSVDREAAEATAAASVFADLPFGPPNEPLPSKEALGFRVPLYGLDRWDKLFLDRQLFALGTFVRHTRAAREAMRAEGYPADWIETLEAYLALAVDRVADRSSTLCRPEAPARGGAARGVINTFSRFALPMNWDFIESVTTEDASGGFGGAVEWVAKVAEHLEKLADGPVPTIRQQSATKMVGEAFDAIVTDPPYYDAIAYSDLMDFFYVWLRRTLAGLSSDLDMAFSSDLSPKWDYSQDDGELIDDPSRFGGDRDKSKAVYEQGMTRAFECARRALKPDGRLVIVFAHKEPDAWEALVSAVIKAGFVVDGSWPIQTEMGNRTRALTSAALSSSVWLVCRKRDETAAVGWDNRVLEEMRTSIDTRLREYWDAGIRGPNFVWAATGPALEAYSRHPIVKKANTPGQTLDVSEFLRAVRRIVVDFVVGRVLSPASEDAAIIGLDDLTTYYLLHRNDFGLDDAPIGPCILYAVSCGLSDSDLADDLDLLARTGGNDPRDDEQDDEVNEKSSEVEEGTGSTVKLKAWHQRGGKSLGEGGDGRPAPLIDQVHRLMHLWKAGDQVKVDEYLEGRALPSNALFHRVLQALIELAGEKSDERSILESVSNHVAGKRPRVESQPEGWNIRREGGSQESEDS